ncbi:hypothetical protein P691DRAFT_738080 [Macrolepiota fuliginosa MF-IS2]|uniref:MYND-type domain-containing protein n=1 Tax=Macrolepiota fuliginosa MF-IS2 TaxID=1400762 RepID=A0A9P6BZ47_9AGAR|nr:hypothetical protein P691DRAFT_738080 [Macrolepiota fuliginosa MF-IS2]
MRNDPIHCQRILTQLKSTKVALAGTLSRSRTHVQGASYTGLGSGYAGDVLTGALCANITGRGLSVNVCQNAGVLACSQCALVKYCSEHCQRYHWSRHRIYCEHELRKMKWRPGWVTEGRVPKFRLDSKPGIQHFYPLWNTTPIFDCLGLASKLSSSDSQRHLKFCFPATGGLPQLIKTVNSLPQEFHGQCDILLNHVDSVVINRQLIILYLLLRSGRDIDESAELATHLMYSAFLTPPCAGYLADCTRDIYGIGPREGDMSFYSTFESRGSGKLYTIQTTTGIKKPVEMATSTYGLTKARRSFHDALFHPSLIDGRDRFLMKLRPPHRLSLTRFWETGVLAPFFLNTNSFNQPNRLHFSSRGEWLGHPTTANPLQGWDIPSVQRTGICHGLDPSDILGCLFFHVKSELGKFARRLQDFCVNIYFTQFDVRILSKAICSGLLPAFGASCFDRIDAGGLVDNLGVGETISLLAPMLNYESPGACILMHSRTWFHQIPCATARSNPRLFEILMKKAKDLPELQRRLRNSNITSTKPAIDVIASTSLLRTIDFLDGFVDHEGSFLEYLDRQDISSICANLGLRMRDHNYHYPKRSGLRIGTKYENQSRPQVPGLHLTKNEFYDLFVLGGAELPTRFVEFEPIPQTPGPRGAPRPSEMASLDQA